MSKVKQIDAVLPQTQCGLCGFGGCMPYAEAIANNNAAINLCPPGGIQTLHNLAALTDQNAEPFIEEMQQKAKPPMLAVIREDECIGCTKCIQACPVDAIIGAAKTMHSILTKDCTGCELCIAPCPVDCIDMITIERDEEEKIAKANHWREKFNSRQSRINNNVSCHPVSEQNNNMDMKKDFIKAALARTQLKKKTFS